MMYFAISAPAWVGATQAPLSVDVMVPARWVVQMPGTVVTADLPAAGAHEAVAERAPLAAPVTANVRPHVRMCEPPRNPCSGPEPKRSYFVGLSYSLPRHFSCSHSVTWTTASRASSVSMTT